MRLSWSTHKVYLVVQQIFRTFKRRKYSSFECSGEKILVFRFGLHVFWQIVDEPEEQPPCKAAAKQTVEPPESVHAESQQKGSKIYAFTYILHDNWKNELKSKNTNMNIASLDLFLRHFALNYLSMSRCIAIWMRKNNWRNTIQSFEGWYLQAGHLRQPEISTWLVRKISELWTRNF